MYERLDYILVTGNLTSKVLISDIDPTYMSDHTIPYITLLDASQTFLCVVEVLGEKIRQNENIEGIICGEHKINKKVAQYADDLWVAMLHKEKGYRALFEILNTFAKFSGLTVNYNKTEIMRIGSLRGSDARYYTELPIFWTDGPIKILGLICTGIQEQMCDLNFDGTMQKAENILNIWSKRTLTLLGKILVVNTLIIPLFIYRLTVIRTPTKKQFEAYRKMITNFLWDKKKKLVLRIAD